MASTKTASIKRTSSIGLFVDRLNDCSHYEWFETLVFLLPFVNEIVKTRKKTKLKFIDPVILNKESK